MLPSVFFKPSHPWVLQLLCLSSWKLLLYLLSCQSPTFYKVPDLMELTVWWGDRQMYVRWWRVRRRGQGVREWQGYSFIWNSEGRTLKRWHWNRGLPEGRRKLRGCLGRSVPDRENSKCKGPEAAVCLACLRNNRESRVAGAQWMRGRVVGERQTDKGQFT